jgi:hypothetical protein
MTHRSRTWQLIAVATVAALVTGASGAVADYMPMPPRAAVEEQVDQGPPPYNRDYLLAVTREMRDSSGNPAMIACLAPLTLLVDVFLLPVEAALGFLE